MGAEALEKVSLYWLCHLPEAGALQIRRIGELAVFNTLWYPLALIPLASYTFLANRRSASFN